MEPKKQILLPIDFEKVSESMIKLGFSIAKVTDSEIVILNVADIKNLSEINFAPFSDRIEEMKKQGSLPNVKYQIVLKKGVPESEILEYAEKNNVLLVVMDTRVKEEKQQDLIGSVAAEVIDACCVPVMAIPRNIQIDDFTYFDSISIASALDVLDLDPFKRIMFMFADYKYDLNIVHILEKKEHATDYQEILKDIDAFIKENHPKVNVTYSIIPLEKSVSTDLVNYFLASSFKLMIIKNDNKRSILNRLFHTSLPKKLVYHAQAPLLVLPINESFWEKYRIH